MWRGPIKCLSLGNLRIDHQLVRVLRRYRIQEIDLTGATYLLDSLRVLMGERTILAGTLERILIDEIGIDYLN
ncbi:hypothetical protein [Pajaroellobacter abortibovis]|uniref:Uncharacterized protein n=1 Tax=Pajaroellobacter abortibovis TaxID=1882918 RepID=A0A1L6MVV5_9BACT|nr:hypothetical protein [Pajaroellobacter abortibovis]APR99557.1 hypothetical protein BCY86_01825 [Pajaroellobacter abortibovis]